MDKEAWKTHKAEMEARRWKNAEGLSCPFCRSRRLRLNGRPRGRQRYFCKSCGSVTSQPKKGKGGT